MKGELTGGCLCGALRYRLTDQFRMQPYACHCTDCRKATGAGAAVFLHMPSEAITATGALLTFASPRAR